ncbi:dephospho-CoA kinase [Peptoniphilus sp.]|uniref:dephospho-CoA kinase n=1 Tax=Peptoniphilus sp. TaxID=1971214 RepID=UPI003995FA5C
MKRCNIIGITGSIATGKSQVSNILRGLGYNVIDSDLIAREVAIRKDILDKIRDHFGEEAVQDNRLNRAYIRNIVFKDEEKLETLNNIMHSEIYKIMLQRVVEEEINFMDVPLLFETLENAKEHGIKYDEIWVVYTSPNIQMERLMARDSIDLLEAKRIIDSQISIEEKRNLADYVIENNEDLDKLRENVLKALERLK